jgi:hypothetical protein
LRAARISLAVLLWSACCVGPGLCQESGSDWTQPLKIGSFEVAPSNPEPAIAADAQGWIHVVWVSRLSSAGSSVLMYTRWDRTAWTTPLDILISPEVGQVAKSPKLAVDCKGRLHVVWLGRLGDVYQSWAHAGEGVSARGWAEPAVISEAPSSGISLTRDESCHLHLVAMDLASQSPYHMRAVDGESWSSPVIVARFAVEALGADPSSSAVVVDAAGRIHIAWRRGETAQDYYARSEDDGASWTEPRELPAPTDSEIVYQNSPSMAAVGRDVVHLSWLGMYTLRADGSLPAHWRFHQMSADGGRSWTPIAEILSDVRGHNGPNAMDVDGSGTVHMITVGGGAGGVHWVYHTRWLGSRWAPEEGIPGSRRSDWGADGPSGSDLTISEGNLLHAVWETRDGDVWYARRRVESAHVTPQAYPDPRATLVLEGGGAQAVESSAREATPTPLPAAWLQEPILSRTQARGGGTGPVIVGAGVTAVAVLVGLAAGMAARRGRGGGP